MPRVFYQLPGLSFDRVWSMGPSRFLPAGRITTELHDAVSATPRSESMQLHQEEVRDLIATWSGDAVLELEVPLAEDGRLNNKIADQLAEEILAVLRFFMRSHVRINVEIHKIGMIGEVRGGIRDLIVLFDQQLPLAASGWSRIGGTVPFWFGQDILDEFDANDALQFIGQQLKFPGDRRSKAGRRALIALTMLDSGLRSLEPSLRILCAAIAVETLFTRSDRTASQSMAIARRVAYLTCEAGCGRSVPHCLYTEHERTQKQLFTEITALAEKGKEWRCSSFLNIAAPNEVLEVLGCPPLFTARNSIAHEGTVPVNEKDLSHLIWVADRALTAGLTWYAANPSADMATLDSHIDNPS